MNISTGIDIVQVDRIERLIASSGASFLNRVFTSVELSECGVDSQRLAARWAAKEAAMKALGQGLDRIAPTDVEVGKGPHGAPVLTLYGSALTAADSSGWSSWSVSISHDGDYATAIVVALSS